MSDMEFVPHTQIDLSEWVFDLEDLFDCPDKVAAKAFTKAVTNTLELTSPHASLPWGWSFIGDGGDGIGGPSVAAPDVIYVDFPFCSDMDTGPTWSVTITELVEDYIKDGARDYGDGLFDKDDKDAVEAARALSAKLRELADMLDAKLPQPRD